jgi:hypothetical protein
VVEDAPVFEVAEEQDADEQHMIKREVDGLIDLPQGIASAPQLAEQSKICAIVRLKMFAVSVEELTRANMSEQLLGLHSVVREVQHLDARVLTLPLARLPWPGRIYA